MFSSNIFPQKRPTPFSMIKHFISEKKTSDIMTNGLVVGRSYNFYSWAYLVPHYPDLILQLYIQTNLYNGRTDNIHTNRNIWTKETFICIVFVNNRYWMH